MREYQPRWVTPEELAHGTQYATDSTDSLPLPPETVSAVSAVLGHLSRNEFEIVESLKAEIIAALDVEPDDFDQQHYGELWARLTVLEGKEAR